MKRHLFLLSKIFISIATIPLWFVKMFISVGYLPNQDGTEFLKVTFGHSMFENIRDLAHPILVYIAIIIALASTIMNVVALKFPNGKAIKNASNAMFWAVVGTFLILCLLASTVARGY